MGALLAFYCSTFFCLGSAPVSLEPVATYGPTLAEGTPLVHPVDVAVSSHGDVYLLDQGRAVVLRLDPSGSLRAEFGGFGWDPGEMWEPACAALSPLGIYVTDPQQEAVLKFDRDGAFVRQVLLTKVGEEISLPLRPWGVAVGPGGEVFVTDPQNGLLLRLDFSDRVEASFGVFGHGATQMNEPRGVHVSSDRRVYLCDSGNRRIQVLDALGNVLYGWPLPDRGEPWDLVVDDWGYCFVTVPGQRRVLVFEPSGAPILTWEPDKTGREAPFLPLGVALGPSDLLYVADGDSGTVSVLSIRRR